MATLHCITGGRRVSAREMLDKIASQNYQIAAENAKLKQQVETLRVVLVECLEALPAQTRKKLAPRIRQVLEKHQSRALRSKAAVQN